MSTNNLVTTKKVNFPNQLTNMVGNLYVPSGLDGTKKYPALVMVHPFGGVKEQVVGTYARKMAERGYVTLAFDSTHLGESGGYPRDTENPSERLEDVRCAIDYLTTLPAVDEDRIGLLGVCAGGSFALAVAATEVRAKAVASVSLFDLGLMAREGWPWPQYDRKTMLVEIGKQRTMEARGLSKRRDPGAPLELTESTARILRQAYDYYRTPRAQHQNSRSVLVFTDFARLMDFNYYSQIETIAPRPVLFIVGGEADTLFMSKPGYEKAMQPKEWFEISGAGHFDLYDNEVVVEKAVARLDGFFGKNL